MKFTTTLLAVRDMDKSLKFYKELFDQEVACDLGWNKP
jgi:catechol 2,3-dioxygenase-like lactoylglutathione lyase family enzyme